MLAEASQQYRGHHDLCEINVVKGVLMTECNSYNFNLFRCFFQEVVKYLPDMTFMLNVRDEPRILKHNCGKESVLPNDTCYCDPGYSHPQHGFFMKPKSWYVTQRLLPIFSSSKIPECFSDILVPSPFHANTDKSNFVLDENILPWKDKTFKVFWRGSMSDGVFESPE